MLTPNQLDKLPEPMIQLMSELQNEIISDICRRITKANYLTPTAEWQLYKANQLTISAREVKRRIAAKLKVRESTLKELYTDAVKTAIREDEIIYKAAIAEGILSDNYRDKLTNYTRSKAFSSVLQRGLKNTNGLMRNLTNSAAAAANRQLSDALDLAFLKCVSGAFTPQDAIFEAVRKLGQDGLKCVSYESGRTDQLDVAVRRAVVTGIGKTCCDMQLDLAKEMDCELVEVTAHLGARPSHAEWQGQIYSLKKGHPKYPYFYDATGYGTGDGLGGWNCRHSFFPYFEGLSVATNAPTFSKEENLEEYTNTQKQRAYERSIRKSKRELAALDSARQEASPELRAKLDREFERKSVTLKKREARLEEHLKATGLLPDNSRVRVDGFGKSVSQKAVWANKKHIANISTNIQSGNIDGYTFEDADKAFLNSNSYKKQFVGLFGNEALERKIEKYSTKAVLDNDNKPSETLFAIPTSSNPLAKITKINKKHYWDLADGVGEKLSNLKNEFILVHNHPNNTSLSLSDLKALNDTDKMKAIISVGHNGKICVVSMTSKNKFINNDDLDFFDRAFACSIRDYGQTNAAIKDFCNKVGWKYHEQSI
ncbi:MAG: phage minor capsid protein [Oscillospiraceae bacterium]|nr:phage minor capsid protein [Oscillospiraceae bacterium]